MSFGRFVRNRRTIIGMSLRSAACRLEVDPAHLSRIEAGKAAASVLLIRRLADMLACEEDVLLLLAGRLPEDIRAMVETQPLRATSALRNMAAMCAEPRASYGEAILAERGERAIEDDFPLDRISEIAEAESWRKEIYRPVYHVHKWWAQRLGSVFRAVILAAASPKGSSVIDLFHAPVRLPGIVVFDPFMGSGTIVGEAQKLGCTAVGRDINPVACRAVRVALGSADRSKVTELFGTLDAGAGAEIRKLYRATDGDGKPCDVLYFFWVKVIQCPGCETGVDLFSSYVFATHARKKQRPESRIVCPGCNGIVTARFDATEVACPSCGARFNPQDGPAKRTTAVCRGCHREFPIAPAIRRTGRPPDHRLYAKLVLRSDGAKEYLPASAEDAAAYADASERLGRLDPPLPRVPICDGFNTRQILNYGYRQWHQLFNDRQLLSLAILAGAIRDLPSGPEREALAVLFSGMLEFNNMFASYKGEGTGAVRPLFSHHVLKPERMPIEANPWGTRKSSGAFATLFRSRLLRALDYRRAPFEVGLEHAGERTTRRRVVGTSPPMGGPILRRYPATGLAPGSIYLSCGDSARTDLPAGSVDLVITDPPFFDNVHYSELADFFFVWQQLYFEDRPDGTRTTRRNTEVQDADADAFAEKLRRVFVECRRVLRDHGLLVFSYHHSREDGWAALARAVACAGFVFVQAHPVKAEMSVATPKSQAREPIDLDVILVCRKRHSKRCVPPVEHEALRRAADQASEDVRRFNAAGRGLSRSDVRVVLLSRLLVALTRGRSAEESDVAVGALLPETPCMVESIWHSQRIHRTPARDDVPTAQAALPFDGATRLHAEGKLESPARTRTLLS